MFFQNFQLREIFTMSLDKKSQVETVVKLVRKKPDAYIDITVDMDELDLTASDAKATYQEIKDYIKKKYDATEEKLRKDEVEDAKTATSVHYSVGREVRTAIEKIGGTMPEDLPTPEKSIQQIEKEQMARLKAKAKNGKLMLDE